MSSMVTVKLDFSNFVVWKHQIEVILETYSMIDAIDETTVAPDQFLKDSSGNFTTKINLAFLTWKNREQALFTFLNSTLSPSVLALTVGQKSSRGVWKVLEKRFASVSRSSVMSLRNELNAVKKASDSIDVYFQKIKQIRDKLTIVSVVLNDEDLLHVALDGLPSEYDSFSSAIRTRSDVISIEELNILLNAEERAIRKRSGLVDTTSMAMIANYQSQGFHRGRGRHNNQRDRGRGGRGNFSGFSGGSSNGPFNPTLPHFNQPQSGQPRSPGFQQNFQGQNQRPQCQICGKNGHGALDCYHRMDFSFQGKHSPSKLTAMVANFAQVHGANGWLTDTGCSDHVTPDLANLSLQQQPTSGTETVTVGNGQELPVTHIGNGFNFREDPLRRIE